MTKYTYFCLSVLQSTPDHSQINEPGMTKFLKHTRMIIIRYMANIQNSILASSI